MATPIEMPKLGNTVEDCLLARWNKRAGDTVAEGELVAEIETDKATFELTSPVAGTLLATFFQAGDLVPVFTNICAVGAPGESVASFEPRASSTPDTDRRSSEELALPPLSRGEGSAVPHSHSPQSAWPPYAASSPRSTGSGPAAPAAMQTAGPLPVPEPRTSGSGPASPSALQTDPPLPVSEPRSTASGPGRLSVPRPASSFSASDPQTSADGAALSSSSQGFYSPRAKRFAAEHGFRPDRVAGSGPQGRVLEEDLRRLYYESSRSTSLARHLMESGFELRGEPSGLVRASDLGPPPEKMSHLRARVARRLRESLAGTAQYTMNASADATGLLALRAKIKASGEARGMPDININEMVMFCAVKALALMPEVNVEFVDGKLYRHPGVNIGFACDTPRGLLVPVVKQAGQLSLSDLAVRIKTLSRQALDGSISPDDLNGGTFTVSNLGVFGIESFSPILNPPQVAILGVNSIELKAVRRDGVVAFVEYIGLSLTCDHQVIDGAPGARFLKTCREQIENVEAIAGMEI